MFILPILKYVDVLAYPGAGFFIKTKATVWIMRGDSSRKFLLHFPDYT
jgi:hypothetical protein